MTEVGYVWLLLVPAVLVWALTLADILRRPGPTRRRRAVWAVAVTLVFPLALVWHLGRPVVPPSAVPLDELDPAERPVRLVTVLVARRRGEIDRATLDDVLDELLPLPEP